MTFSVFEAAREAPDRLALIHAGRPVTFATLAERMTARIAALSMRGLPDPAGRPVAVVGRSDLPTLELVYALVELGQPVALVHPRLTEHEQRALIGALAPVATLAPTRDSVSTLRTPGATATAAPPAATPGASGTSPSVRPAPVPARRFGPSMDAERPLAVLFTSGTSGAPKGVVLSRRAFEASARASEKNLGWRADDRWLLGLPIAHVGGLSVVTRCLLARRTVIVPRATAMGMRLDARALAAVIDEARVTLVSLVPTQLEWLLAERPAWTPPAHLRAVLLGGAPARPQLLAEAADRGVPVLTTYGMTEACSQVTTQRVGTVNRGELGSGHPMDGVEVRVADGAIHVRGQTLFSGYHGASESPLDADGWYRTGDLGRFDGEGRLHVLGRSSDLIVTGGENVHPAEVESVLERCPGIARACVFGVADAIWGQVIAAAIVEDPDGAPTNADLLDHLRDRMAPYRRPRLIARVSTLAVNAAGKLDRAQTARDAAAQLRPLS